MICLLLVYNNKLVLIIITKINKVDGVMNVIINIAVTRIDIIYNPTVYEYNWLQKFGYSGTQKKKKKEKKTIIKHTVTLAL